MKIFAAFTILTSLAISLAACSSQESTPLTTNSQIKTPPASAALVDPLKVGEHAANTIVRRPNGSEVAMAKLYAKKPTVLIFYRGGWCPYCNAQLGKLAEAQDQLVQMGYQLLAVSPDRPAELQSTLDKGNYKYQLLSDSKMNLVKAFGLAFHVDDGTVEKYQHFGIDLDKASGEHHHLLPVPAVYIIDRSGVIQYAYWNPDYKTRLDNDVLLKAAHDALGK